MVFRMAQKSMTLNDPERFKSNSLMAQRMALVSHAKLFVILCFISSG